MKQLRDYITTFATWILGILLFLGATIMYASMSAPKYSAYIFGIGLVMAGIPALILLVYLKKETKKLKNNREVHIDWLKENGIRIEANLSSCEILSTNWTTEEARYSDRRIRAWNAIGGDPELNVKHVEHHISKVIYKTEHNGEKYEFERTINKDEHTVKMLLEFQGTTSIYVDKNDKHHYYFDLEFLKS